jgi:hypothetical protein
MPKTKKKRGAQWDGMFFTAYFLLRAKFNLRYEILKLKR